MIPWFISYICHNKDHHKKEIVIAGTQNPLGVLSQLFAHDHWNYFSSFLYEMGTMGNSLYPKSSLGMKVEQTQKVQVYPQRIQISKQNLIGTR